MRARGTSQEAHEIQVRLYRRMTPAQRPELALRMSDDVRRVAAEGIKQRHPGLLGARCPTGSRRILYGKDAAAKVWPGEPVPSP